MKEEITKILDDMLKDLSDPNWQDTTADYADMIIDKIRAAITEVLDG